MTRRTLGEAWQSVSQLRPRLRATVQLHRRNFRGRTWYVAQAPAGEHHYRLSERSWRFAGLLDGRRTVEDVWRLCRQELGEDAPTQSEVLQLLANLHHAHLLTGASGASLMLTRPPHGSGAARLPWHPLDLLCVRLPIWDPDPFLTRWTSLYKGLFSRVGLGLWSLLIAAGIASVIQASAPLTAGMANALSLRNVPLLYAALLLLKTLHELAHAAACKTLGLRDGGDGKVGSLGLMFVLLVPVPYVDASSSWTLRRKSHRIVVAAAGVLAELAVAATAAMLWSVSPAGSALHGLCYNLMWLAGVSAFLLNGNPLVRFDGYYILSDWLEMPNLAQRGTGYLHYLVKRYVWGVTIASSPTADPTERKWLLAHAVGAGIYRIALYSAVCVLLWNKWFFLGVALAFTAIAAWILAPAARLLHYLIDSHELRTRRKRAIVSTCVVAAAAVAIVGFVPVTDRSIIDGVLESQSFTEIYAAEDGFVDEIAPRGASLDVGAVILRTHNSEVAAQHAILDAEARRARIACRIAQRDRDIAASQIAAAQLAKATLDLKRTESQRDALVIRAPLSGVWRSANPHASPGHFVRRGEHLGTLVATDALVARAVAAQAVAAQLFAEPPCQVRLRVEGRPDIETGCAVLAVLPAGQRNLPSAALSIPAGGAIAVMPSGPDHTKALEQFFELRVKPADVTRMRHGQRARIRLDFVPKPLGVQWTRAALRLFQRKFPAENDRF